MVSNYQKTIVLSSVTFVSRNYTYWLILLLQHVKPRKNFLLQELLQDFFHWQDVMEWNLMGRWCGAGSQGIKKCADYTTLCGFQTDVLWFWRHHLLQGFLSFRTFWQILPSTSNGILPCFNGLIITCVWLIMGHPTKNPQKWIHIQSLYRPERSIPTLDSVIHVCSCLPCSLTWLPSRELTYPPFKGIFEDDFPFPQVGYVSFLVEWLALQKRHHLPGNRSSFPFDAPVIIAVFLNSETP